MLEVGLKSLPRHSLGREVGNLRVEPQIEDIHGLFKASRSAGDPSVGDRGGLLLVLGGHRHQG